MSNTVKNTIDFYRTLNVILKLFIVIDKTYEQRYNLRWKSIAALTVHPTRHVHALFRIWIKRWKQYTIHQACDLEWNISDKFDYIFIKKVSLFVFFFYLLMHIMVFYFTKLNCLVCIFKTYLYSIVLKAMVHKAE